MRNLVFNYPSTARIRFKKKNVYYSEEYPHIYRIITKHLDFYVPKGMTLFSTTYIFIPLDYYKRVLSTFYLRISGVNY